MLSVDGEIRRDEGCIDYAGQFVMIYPCHGMKGNQEWVYGLVCIGFLLNQFTFYAEAMSLCCFAFFT